MFLKTLQTFSENLELSKNCVIIFQRLSKIIKNFYESFPKNFKSLILKYF